MFKPTIALVQGDACGIGPELMSKLLAIAEVRESANILILSDKRIFDAGDAITGNKTVIRQIESVDEMDFTDNIPNFIDTKQLDPSEVTPAVASKPAGAAVLHDLGMAVDLAEKGIVNGICFMPFNKHAMHLAGLGVEDELTWIKNRLQVKTRASEFNVVDGMWNGRVTSHIPLKEVCPSLNIAVIVEAIQLGHDTLKDAGYDDPRIAVAGVNPHAGDEGSLGMEEIEIIRPAVEKARSLGLNANGPFPGDTMYLKIRDGFYDCAITMYHDQGQIAIKLLGFEKGVSVLAGLPIPTTTPAHGTAFDIVGTNKANVVPTKNAFMMNVEMATNKFKNL